MNTTMIEIDWFLKNFHHSNLTDNDICYYLMEYTSGPGYGASEANQLIFNFKKDLSKRGQYGWHYKEEAINKIAKIYNFELKNIIDFKKATLVPIPPSKCKSNPIHDDRMLKLLTKVSTENNADVRELLLIKNDMNASHTSNNRDVDDIMDYIEINIGLYNDLAENIYLFDDVLVTDAHFAACRNIVLSILPEKKIFGIFIARATS